MICEVGHLHPEVKKKSIELAKSSVTKREIYEKVVKLDAGENGIDWDQVLCSSNEFIRLYTL